MQQILQTQKKGVHQKHVYKKAIKSPLMNL